MIFKLTIELNCWVWTNGEIYDFNALNSLMPFYHQKICCMLEDANDVLFYVKYTTIAFSLKAYQMVGELHGMRKPFGSSQACLNTQTMDVVSYTFHLRACLDLWFSPAGYSMWHQQRVHFWKGFAMVQEILIEITQCL